MSIQKQLLSDVQTLEETIAIAKRRIKSGKPHDAELALRIAENGIKRIIKHYLSQYKESEEK